MLFRERKIPSTPPNTIIIFLSFKTKYVIDNMQLISVKYSIYVFKFFLPLF